MFVPAAVACVALVVPLGAEVDFTGMPPGCLFPKGYTYVVKARSTAGVTLEIAIHLTQHNEDNPGEIADTAASVARHTDGVRFVHAGTKITLRTFKGDPFDKVWTEGPGPNPQAQMVLVRPDDIYPPPGRP